MGLFFLQNLLFSHSVIVKGSLCGDDRHADSPVRSFLVMRTSLMSWCALRRWRLSRAVWCEARFRAVWHCSDSSASVSPAPSEVEMICSCCPSGVLWQLNELLFLKTSAGGLAQWCKVGSPILSTKKATATKNYCWSVIYTPYSSNKNIKLKSCTAAFSMYFLYSFLCHLERCDSVKKGCLVIEI